MFLLLTLNIFHTFFSVSVRSFEKVNVSWKTLKTEKKTFHEIKNVLFNHNYTRIARVLFDDGIEKKGFQQKFSLCTFLFPQIINSNLSSGTSGLWIYSSIVKCFRDTRFMTSHGMSSSRLNRETKIFQKLLLLMSKKLFNRLEIFSRHEEKFIIKKIKARI